MSMLHGHVYVTELPHFDVYILLRTSLWYWLYWTDAKWLCSHTKQIIWIKERVCLSLYCSNTAQVQPTVVWLLSDFVETCWKQHTTLYEKYVARDYRDVGKTSQALKPLVHPRKCERNTGCVDMCNISLIRKAILILDSNFFLSLEAGQSNPVVAGLTQACNSPAPRSAKVKLFCMRWQKVPNSAQLMVKVELQRHPPGLHLVLFNKHSNSLLAPR